MLRMLRFARGRVRLRRSLPLAHAAEGARGLDRPAGRDHLDRPALSQPLAQQLAAAARLRAADHARREPEARAGRSRRRGRPLDDLTWEFKLRKNVKFHDGTPFTADDVVATYKRVPNVPNSPSSIATFTKPIVETKVVDPHTIIFKTAAPHVLLPSDLASVYIVPKAIAEKADDRGLQLRQGGDRHRPLQVRRVRSQPARGAQGELRLLGRRGAVGQGHLQDPHQLRRRASPRCSSGDVQMIETVPTSDIAKLASDKNFALADKVPTA